MIDLSREDREALWADIQAYADAVSEVDYQEAEGTRRSVLDAAREKAQALRARLRNDWLLLDLDDEEAES